MVLIDQCSTNFSRTNDVLRSAAASAGLPEVVTVAFLWILLAVLLIVLIGTVVPRRFRTSIVLTIYDVIFGLPYIVVQVVVARGNWYKLCLRGKLMWLGRVSRDKAEHYSGEWIPCLMTQRFNYPALEYKTSPVIDDDRSKRDGGPLVDPVAIAEVERAFAAHYGAEDALLFVSGFVCNVETLTAIATQNPQVVFLWDSNCHRSLIEGFRTQRNLSFPHNDMHALEQMIQKEALTSGATIWLIVESPYSMEGDSVDLAKLLELRTKYGVRLYIDAAHSLGVEQEFSNFDVRIVSLSKCAGLYGGVMLGPRSLTSWIRTHGIAERRAYPKCSIPPIHEFLRVLQDGTIAKRADKVHKLACFAYDALVRDGWHVRSPRGAYILCVQVGTPYVVGCMQQWCLRHGVYLAMIGYPGIPWKHYLGFRIIITAALTEADIQLMVNVMHAFLSPLTFFDVLRDFVKPEAWGWSDCQRWIGKSDEPPQNEWGESAARLLGGNSMEQLHLERTLAARYGYDRCSVCSDSEFGLRDWKKLIPTVKVLASIDEVQSATTAYDAVMTPIKPFGLALFCKNSVWKEEFWLRQKMLLHSTAVPPYVYAHMITGGTTKQPVEKKLSESERP